ncbi:MAG: EamA family transporter [Pseudomonadota bacterium]
MAKIIQEDIMGATDRWFIYALIGMLSFSGMALVFKKLTYYLPTSLILVYVFALTSVMLFTYQLKTADNFKIDVSSFFWILLAAGLAFVANIFDLEALKHAPNAGYASAVKAGQILVITLAALYLFDDQKITMTGILGVLLIFSGIGLLATQK